ncbi:serine/threonine-protein kinase [Amycolatopsis regifaucium]|uniref:non-specific serine/threonine protein kinase n=1 Tax=Amycolatopsis regifaucium TaxID=546365 RepID=A0A154MFB9_9PSEU|nr:serine/threonine-protein kinase [Amycolatopsis regifaucium]KZB82903.1 serine/threonine protein kinase [Amycolatopsis regifaucium]OKA03346.1 serine/threonine protein kinase [Amycolatopsis regifaucium]SFJ68081.1 Serine/threonine protein kinase [Amycolatopsis regifaucium]
MDDAGARTGGEDEDLDAGTTQRRFSLNVHDPDHLPHRLAGRYEVGDLLGRGATARVFRAYDLREGREVALKLFHADTMTRDQRRREQEIQTLSAVRHPGLVPLYDTGSDDGYSYLTMRLVEGPNLAQRLRSGPLSHAAVVDLAARLADALAHVHAHGITHRDLKPANILMADDGPLIGDFGVAHAFDATRVTETGGVVGTAAYMAPEQVRGEKVGPPADVYALGLVLLECLSGEREYTGTPVEAAVGRLHRQPRIPDGLSTTMTTLLRGMTARKPSQRPTAAAIARILLEDSTGTAVALPAAVGRKRAAVVAAISAPAAAITIGVLLAVNQPGANPPSSPEGMVPPATSATSGPVAGEHPPSTEVVEVPAHGTKASGGTVVVTEKVPVTTNPPATGESAGVTSTPRSGAASGGGPANSDKPSKSKPRPPTTKTKPGVPG